MASSVPVYRHIITNVWCFKSVQILQTLHTHNLIFFQYLQQKILLFMSPKIHTFIYQTRKVCHGKFLLSRSTSVKFEIQTDQGQYRF